MSICLYTKGIPWMVVISYEFLPLKLQKNTELADLN